MPLLALVTALIGFGLVWGVTIPMLKIAVSTGHAPIGLIVWQQVYVALLLCTVMLVRRKSLLPKFRHFELYLGVALLGTIIPNSFSFLAAANLPAGIMGIAVATVPMFALMIALLIRDERFQMRRLFGVVLGAVAVLILVVPEASLPDPAMIPFIFIALVAPFCYGAEANFISRRAPPDIDPIGTLFWASVLGALLSAPIALFTGSWVDLTEPWTRAEWGLLASSLGHSIAYTGYVWLVGQGGAVFTSQISYVVTGSAVLFSALILGETYSYWVLLALVVMLGGLALVSPRGDRTTTGITRPGPA